MKLFNDLKEVKMKKINFVALICLCLCIISGNLTAQQFIPKGLKKVPEDSLSKIVINQKIHKNVKIDNKKVKKSSIVFLKPGKHTINYSVKVYTGEYTKWVKSMQEKGWVLRSDGTFVKDGTIATPMIFGGPKDYRWDKKSKEIVIQIGKTYKL